MVPPSTLIFVGGCLLAALILAVRLTVDSIRARRRRRQRPMQRQRARLAELRAEQADPDFWRHP